jgi:hypothetical protein
MRKNIAYPRQGSNRGRENEGRAGLEEKCENEEKEMELHRRMRLR